jgi:hypothetical protein
VGVLLLGAGGAGLYFYMNHGATAAAQVAGGTPQPGPSAPAPAPSATPEVIPPNPDFAGKDQAKPATPEVIPPNPDFAGKDQAKPASKEVIPPNPDFAPKKAAAKSPAAPGPGPAPANAPRVARVTNPTSGTLHAAVEVAQNGEVVFENLPGGRLKFTFDHDAWRPTISHQANGTQTLVMRSLKPGIQRSCDVRWEIVQ